MIEIATEEMQGEMTAKNPPVLEGTQFSINTIYRIRNSVASCIFTSS
jgi:hypothetical protein